MLITFKTLEQKTFKIEIDEKLKVLALKEKIAEEKGADLFPVAGQKLIYAGKILDDDKNIGEFNIDTIKNFVVVMVVKSKAKVADKPKESETTTTPSASSSQSAEATAISTNTETSETPTTAGASVTTATAEETTTTIPPAETVTTETPSHPVESQNTTEMAESALLTGSALESSITELMSLGYSREEVMMALNRSFHNADRAAEYLLSGNIPDLPNEPEDIDTPAVQNIAPGSNLDFLRNLPQFQLMRRQVQDHPETLPQLLQQIGRSNPELLSVISQNQEAFIALLNEPSTATTESAAGGQAGSGAEGGAEGPLQIQVTASEKESIDRMVSMGFAEGEVIQAFFACDKNEQLAIEFLLKD